MEREAVLKRCPLGLSMQKVSRRGSKNVAGGRARRPYSGAMTFAHAPSTPLPSPPLQRSRRVERQVQGQPTSDGAGVKLTRVLTPSLQRRLDPFLMLDAFGTDRADDYIGGFPDHPHRGFETVTYMLAGRMRHHDSVGNVGLLEPGSLQWMTAGRGIVHSEMPEQQAGRMAGFQLWVNLSARDKLQPPAYRDVPPAEVPAFTLDGGVAVRVLAGSSHGVQGAVTRPVTEPLYLDVTLPPGTVFEQALPVSHNAFVYVFGGGPVVIEGERVDVERMAILGNGDVGDAGADGVRLHAPGASSEAVRLLLVAGRPLNETIVQHGPFVMNTAQEIRQAVADFQRGVLAG
jgi:redox-sensitive bicupin YhaK (pirin superfamily)